MNRGRNYLSSAYERGWVVTRLNVVVGKICRDGYWKDNKHKEFILKTVNYMLLLRDEISLWNVISSLWSIMRKVCAKFE